jgi:hypothetical protein
MTYPFLLIGCKSTPEGLQGDTAFNYSTGSARGKANAGNRKERNVQSISAENAEKA